MQRLERKVAAGAQFFMTQPVFDVDLVREMQRRTQHLRVPLFTGVWPLFSSREAEFLHTGCKLPKRLLLQHSDISLAST